MTTAITVSKTGQLVGLREAYRQLAKAETVEEVKVLHDNAAAIKHLMARRGYRIDERNLVACFVVDAARDMGKRLAGMEKAKGASEKGWKTQVHSEPAFVDLGIERNVARRTQTIAAIKAKEYAAEKKKLLDDKADITEAYFYRYQRRKRAAKKLAAIRAKSVTKPEGFYDVIVVDPPWAMKKIEREVRPNQVTALDYPTMTEPELTDLKLPMAKECHVWVWATHRFLPMAFRLLTKWGLRYVCTFVWHKPGGFQPVGLPQYNCEFALYARRGSPSFVDTKAFNVCFDAPRGRHSEKPEAFYEIVRRVTGERRLNMFSRRALEGFDGWGQEA